MVDSVSLRPDALAALETRKPAAATVSGPLATRSGPEVAASSAKAAAGNTATTGSVARMLSQSAPVDAGRVAELRQALKNGSYVVQPERLADAMLASWKA